MITASPNYLFRNAIFLILTLTILTTRHAAASATGQQSSSAHRSNPQAAEPQRQQHHHLHSNIIPVKHLNFHGPAVPTDGTAKNEFDRLNNRRYYGGRVTRAQVHEAVVKTAKHSHTNEIYVMAFDDSQCLLHFPELCRFKKNIFPHEARKRWTYQAALALLSLEYMVGP
eukprot:scaffold1433_cov132-Skeletonema_menzelii.AAC.5